MKTITLNQIQPEIKGANEFRNSSMQYRCEYNKRSYTHRLMCITGGSCSFYYGQHVFRCEVGDIVYFPPDQLYGNDFSGRDFRVINLFFDFYPYRGESYVYSTIYVKDNCLPEYMGESVHFSDCPFFNSLQHMRDFPDALERTASICREFSERQIGYKQKANAMLTDLLISLLRFQETTSMTSEGNSAGDILAYIQQNCRLPLDGQSLSEKFNYHPNYINKLVRKATSMTLHTYILDTKIRNAAVMLAETDMSITEIAMWFSFYDSSHFSNVFRKFYGCSPHEYRKKNRGGTSGVTYL